MSCHVSAERRNSKSGDDLPGNSLYKLPDFPVVLSCPILSYPVPPKEDTIRYDTIRRTPKTTGVIYTIGPTGGARWDEIPPKTSTKHNSFTLRRCDAAVVDAATGGAVRSVCLASKQCSRVECIHIYLI